MEDKLLKTGGSQFETGISKDQGGTPVANQRNQYELSGERILNESTGAHEIRISAKNHDNVKVVAEGVYDKAQGTYSYLDNFRYTKAKNDLELRRVLLTTICSDAKRITDKLSISFHINTPESEVLDTLKALGDEADITFYLTEEDGSTRRITKMEALDVAYDLESGYSLTLRVEVDLASLNLPRSDLEIKDTIERGPRLDHWEEASKLLNSEDFLVELRSFPEAVREKVIGRVVEFLTIFESTENWKDIIETLHGLDFTAHDAQRKIDATIVELIAKKLGLKEVDSLDSKEKVFDYFQSRHDNGYFYHGFNGVFEEDIAKHGLSTQKRKWDWEEMRRISRIGDGVGYRMLLGWSNINSESTSYVSAVADNAYRYALASPEWFGHFVAEGQHVPIEDKAAYRKRDYSAAKKNVLRFCNENMSRNEEEIKAGRANPNLTIDEKIEILTFFEKYWKIFANEKSKPKLALVKRSTLGYYPRKVSFRQVVEKNGKRPEDENIVDVIASMQSRSAIDIPFKTDIEPSNLRIIDLPTYEAVNSVK